MKLWRTIKSLFVDHVWHVLVLQLGEPEFYTEDEAELAKRLTVSDNGLSAALLAEAEQIDRNNHDSAEGIEARAMTLQGAVAIATTLTLAAGGFLIDRTKVESNAWRISFAAVFLLTVLCFIAAGIRAIGASSRTHAWTYPGFTDIFEHARLQLSDARAAYAAAHLKSAGMNLRIIQLKGGYLNAAVFWFRLALALLVVLAAMFLAYSVSLRAAASPSNRRPSVNSAGTPQAPRASSRAMSVAPSPRPAMKRTRTTRGTG
jgi:cytochrome oxidase assembly protein ShyY1